eukprot:jgi/Bigna1/66230/fgenesh1_pg.1_\
MVRITALIFIICSPFAAETLEKDFARFDVVDLASPPAPRIQLLSIRYRLTGFQCTGKELRLYCNNQTYPLEQPRFVDLAANRSIDQSRESFALAVISAMESGISNGTCFSAYKISPLDRSVLLKSKCNLEVLHRAPSPGVTSLLLHRDHHAFESRERIKVEDSGKRKRRASLKDEHSDPNSAFAEIAAKIEAKLQSGARTGQMFSMLTDESLSTVPGILIQLYMKMVSPQVTKDLVKKGAKGLWGFLNIGKFTDHCISAFDAQITYSLMNDAAVHTANEARVMLEPQLGAALNATLTDAWVENLVGPLTKSVSKALAESSESILKTELLQHVTSQVTASFTRTVTRTLGHVLGRALSRNPIDDYYCYYCREHQIFCEACQKGVQHGANYDQASTVYANYYGNYYGSMYSSGGYAKSFVKTYEEGGEKAEKAGYLKKQTGCLYCKK